MAPSDSDVNIAATSLPAPPLLAGEASSFDPTSVQWFDLEAMVSLKDGAVHLFNKVDTLFRQYPRSPTLDLLRENARKSMATIAALTQLVVGRTKNSDTSLSFHNTETSAECWSFASYEFEHHQFNNYLKTQPAQHVQTLAHLTSWAINPPNTEVFYEREATAATIADLANSKRILEEKLIAQGVDMEKKRVEAETILMENFERKEEWKQAYKTLEFEIQSPRLRLDTLNFEEKALVAKNKALEKEKQEFRLKKMELFAENGDIKIDNENMLAQVKRWEGKYNKVKSSTDLAVKDLKVVNQKLLAQVKTSEAKHSKLKSSKELALNNLRIENQKLLDKIETLEADNKNLKLGGELSMKKIERSIRAFRKNSGLSDSDIEDDDSIVESEDEGEEEVEEEEPKEAEKGYRHKGTNSSVPPEQMRSDVQRILTNTNGNNLRTIHFYNEKLIKLLEEDRSGHHLVTLHWRINQTNKAKKPKKA